MTLGNADLRLDALVERAKGHIIEVTGTSVYKEGEGSIYFDKMMHEKHYFKPEPGNYAIQKGLLIASGEKRTYIGIAIPELIDKLKAYDGASTNKKINFSEVKVPEKKNIPLTQGERSDRKEITDFLKKNFLITPGSVRVAGLKSEHLSTRLV